MASPAGSKALKPAVVPRLAAAVLAVAVLAVAGWRAPAVFADRWVQDDAYVSFRYARNLVEGHGLVYNPGEAVEGYTNPLWTMLAAVPLAVGAEDPLPFMQWAGLLLWLAAFGVLIVFGAALAGRGFAALPLAALTLLALWSFGAWFVSGMETGLVVFLTLLALAIAAVQDLERPLPAAALGLVAVLLLLARPDTLFFLLGVALAGLLCHWRWLGRRDFWRCWLPAALAAPVLIYLPYTLWRLDFYGRLLPNTYWAKMAWQPMWERGLLYLDSYFAALPILPFAALAVLGAVVAEDAAVRRFLAASVLGSAGSLLYLWRLGGDFMEWRFMMPVTAVLTAGAVLGAAAVGRWTARMLARLLRRTAPRAAAIAGLVCAVATAAAMTSRAMDASPRVRNAFIPGQETIASLAKYTGPDFDWAAVGRACDRVLPRDVRIATTAAGMIPYFARRPALDLHGLTSPEIAHRPFGPDEVRGRLGHERTLEDPTVMGRMGVGVVVPAGLPNSRIPQSWGVDGFELFASAVVLLPDQRFFEIRVLEPAVDTVRTLLARDDVVFENEAHLVANDRPMIHAEVLATHQRVDRLDLGDVASENAHRFWTVDEPGIFSGNPAPEKVLAYLEPVAPLTVHSQGRRAAFHPIRWHASDDGEEPTPIVRDGGRAISHEAHWLIDGVRADRDLVVLVRSDRAGFSRYRLFINGYEAPRRLELLHARDSWQEAAVLVPAELVSAGANDLGLVRDRGLDGISVLYHVWCFQPRSP